MTWETINASDVDANSPLSSTLMGRIRNNLIWLWENADFLMWLNDWAGNDAVDIHPTNKDVYEAVLYFHRQTDQALTDESVNVVRKTAPGMLYIPPASKDLKLSVYMRPHAGSSGFLEKARFKLYNTSDALVGTSDEHTFSADGLQNVELVLEDCPTGFVYCVLEVYEESGIGGGDDWGYVRAYGEVTARQ